MKLVGEHTKLTVNRSVDCCFVSVYNVLKFCPFLNRAFYLKEVAVAVALTTNSSKK